MDFIGRVSSRTVRVLAACVASVAIPLAAHPGSASAQPRDFTVAVQQVPDRPIFTGGVVAYVVTVANAGPQASAAAVRVTLPSEFRDVAFRTPPASGFACSSPSSSVVSCTRAPLVGTDEVRVTATVPSSLAILGSTIAPRPRSFTITAQADPNDDVQESNEQNNTATVTTRVDPAPDLDVDLSGSSTAGDVGQEITYIVRLLNVGDAATTVADVNATLPEQVAFVRLEPVAGQQFAPDACSSAGRVFNCKAASMQPGQTLAVRIVARVTNSAGDRQILFGATADPANAIRERDENNNSASVLTTIRAASDLRIAGTVTKQAVINGPFAGITLVTLRLTATNAGPSSSPPTRVRIAWPSGFSNPDLLCTTGTGFVNGSCVEGQRTNCFNSCSVGTVLPGGSQVVTTSAGFQSLVALSTFFITVTVDPDGTVFETNDNNNSATLELRIP